jgi:hypothetical protein
MCYFYRRKFHMSWPAMESGPPQWTAKPATNRTAASSIMVLLEPLRDFNKRPGQPQSAL